MTPDDPYYEDWANDIANERDALDSREYQEHIKHNLLDAVDDFLQFSTVRQLLKLIAEHV